MSEDAGLRADLEAAMGGSDGALAVADRLCVACVELLHVDGAAISLMHKGLTPGTFGSSGPISRRLDELQFTFGEGPCMEAVERGRPVLVADIGDALEQRWPAFAEAALAAGVRAVFALPTTVARTHIGVLDLFRNAPGPLSDEQLHGGLLAADLAALPLLDLMTADVRTAGAASEGELESLSRVEVYQATGMLMEQLDVGPADALVRLRAHAFATGQTASEVAWAVVERRLVLDADDTWGIPGGQGGGR